METALAISALGLGFASGFHCIGMCGPIAFSMGLAKRNGKPAYLPNLTYQFGRIITYASLGAVLGIFGQAFQMAGLQKYLTITAGLLLVFMAVFSFGGKDFSSKIPGIGKFLMSVKKNLAKLLQKADLKSRFFTGILNGFLPCGMVYMALTASLAAGGMACGAAYMALFGLGTLPFMFLAAFAGNIVTQALRLKILKVVPVLLLVLGGLFILRGMEIGIPYISPKAESMQISSPGAMQMQHGAHDCCH